MGLREEAQQSRAGLLTRHIWAGANIHWQNVGLFSDSPSVAESWMEVMCCVGDGVTSSADRIWASQKYSAAHLQDGPGCFHTGVTRKRQSGHSGNFPVASSLSKDLGTW